MSVRFQSGISEFTGREFIQFDFDNGRSVRSYFNWPSKLLDTYEADTPDFESAPDRVGICGGMSPVQLVRELNEIASLDPRP